MPLFYKYGVDPFVCGQEHPTGARTRRGRPDGTCAPLTYGFAAFTVDPGATCGGIMTTRVTYCDVVGNDSQLAAFESFTLRRRRND